MSLKIVLGRAGSGKSTFMLRDMEFCEDALYIVPDQFSFSAEKKITEKFGVSGLGNPEVLSFHRLAEKIIAKYGRGDRIISDKAAREMLVSYCTSFLDPSVMTVFKGLAEKNMLSSAASDLITMFKHYNISPSALKKAAEEVKDPLLAKKLSDSYIILDSYNSKLEECGMCDPEDILTQAVEILKSGADFFSGQYIYIDQFSDFDPEQLSFIGEMLKSASLVCIGLCCDDNPVFSVTQKTRARLMNLAERLGIETEPDEYSDGAMYKSSPMLKYLEENYFSNDSKALSGSDANMRIFCGKNPSSEIRDVSESICFLVREKGYRYRDISVVARDMEEYKNLISRIFPLYDIPVFLDKKIPLSGHCVTLFITGVLDIMTGGFTYENVFRYVKSPFSPIDPADADKLENYCLAHGIRPYMWKNDFKASDVDSETLLYINSLREKIYSPLEELTKKVGGKMKISELCRRLFGFFEDLMLEEKIEKYAGLLEKNGENLYALQTMQVYNILTDIISTLCSIMGDDTIDLRTFSTVINAGLNAVEVGTIPSESDCVTAGSIDRIKGHGARAVFLIGVNSGKFPAAIKESGIFSENDKHTLSALGIELPPGVTELAESEQLLVYDALTCASEKLSLSYSVADSGGSALLPSDIITRISELFPDITFEDNILGDTMSIKKITSIKATFEVVAANIRKALEKGEELDDITSGAAAFFMNHPEYSEKMKSLKVFASYTNEPKTVDAKTMEKLIGSDMQTSISRLETYNRCPFSYFSKYILRLKPRKVFEVSSSDSGSFLHDFINKFSEYVAQGNSWKTIDESFIDKTTDLILSDMLSEINPDYLAIPRIRALFMRLKRVSLKSVYAVRNHIIKSDFIPLGYEISFDKNGKFKPIKLTLADGKKITLRGRIDRADVYECENGAFARIVDYKSGDKKISLEDVYHGLQLQLFVYLSNMCDNGYMPGGILYCTLSDPIIEVPFGCCSEEAENKHSEKRKMRGIILDENDILSHMGGEDVITGKKYASYKNFNSMFRHLKREIKKAASSIYSGNFPIEHTENACNMCDYMSLCGFDPSFSGCRVKAFDKMSDEEVWQKTEASENEMD